MKNVFWLGTEDSYEAYLKASAKAEAKREDWLAKGNSEDDFEFPSMYERVGDVGVVSISGSLIEGEAGWLRLFGMTGYDDIKAALVEAVADKGAKSIMLNINSPGGAVAGVEAAEQFVANVAQVKPMSVYSTMAASAAYWLASAAGHITTGSTSINGSLGVLRIITDYSKAYEMEGITKTVMRSGRYKALVNGVEPLTEEAKAEVQSKLDDIYAMFIGTVARNRGTTEIIADQVMGQGREFLGKRGLEAGLVDAIGDFEAAIAYAARNRKLAGQKNANFPSGATATIVGTSAIAYDAATSNLTGQPMKRQLTPEQLAAIAAGATLAQVTGEESETTPENKTEETTAEIDAEVTTEEETEGTTEASAQPEGEVVKFLKTELATASADLATAKAQNATLASQVSALEADQKTLMEVVSASVNSFHVALGSTVDTAKMSAAELVAEYTAASALMKEKFKVGKVARSTASTETPAKPVAALLTPRDAAAITQMFNRKKG